MLRSGKHKKRRGRERVEGDGYGKMGSKGKKAEEEWKRGGEAGKDAT